MDNVQEKRKMIIRFHTMLGALGIDNEGKLDLLGGYGVESSKDLTVEQLEKICEFLSGMVREKDQKRDRMRKRALRAVCQLMESLSVEKWEGMKEGERIEYAKGVICRAAGTPRFNRIGVDRLRSIAFSFEKQKKDLDNVVMAASSILKN